VSSQEIWQFLRWGSPLGWIFSFILGACLGSFANVVIWRLPRGQSLIKPGSHCPMCAAPIPMRRNIPILSYFLLQGKAPCCGNPISTRYLLVELFCALVLAALYLLEGWTLNFVFAGAWMILLIILAAIDVEHYRLPNVLVGCGTVLSLLWMLVRPGQSWSAAGLGLLAGLVVGAIMLLTARRVSGQWAGFGDFKLIAILGFAFGFGRFVILILSAAFAALLYGLLRRQQAAERRIPFGPFLAIGTWVAICCGETAVRWYLGLLH